jgi:hypothetical protein
MPLTVQEVLTELENRLPMIETRIVWLRDRESKGIGRGPDTQARLHALIASDLAALRTAVELPPGPVPIFTPPTFGDKA